MTKVLKIPVIRNSIPQWIVVAWKLAILINAPGVNRNDDTPRQLFLLFASTTTTTPAKISAAAM